MLHVIVKHWPGETERQKRRLANAITNAVVKELHHSVDSVSVAFEEIKPQDWAEKVYQPDILSTPAKLYKKPRYTL